MSLQNIPRQVLQYMCDFLSIIDTISFSLTCRQFRAIRVDPISRIRKLIGPEMQQFIRENNLILSGSFLLHVLTDCGYGDIDLFADERNTAVCNSPFLKKYTHLSTTSLFTDVKHVTISEINKYVDLDLIFVNGNIMDYIKNQFDLNICKNTYDGVKFKIHDLNAIITRSDTINITYINNTYTGNFEKRYKKYKNRGFNIKINIPSLLEWTKYQNIGNLNRTIIETFKMENRTLRDFLKYDNLYEFCTQVSPTKPVNGWGIFYEKIPKVISKLTLGQIFESYRNFCDFEKELMSYTIKLYG